MREDFVTRLQVQLREAAEREARRRPIRRAARPALAVAAVAVLAGFVLAAGAWLRGGDSAPAGHDQLRVLRTTAVATQGGQLASGFGSVWLADPTGGVVRIDPRTGRILDPIPTGRDIRVVTVGAGAVWALGPAGEVLRIDPATGRIVARIPLGVEDLGELMIAQDTVWVRMGPELVRIDGNVVGRRTGVMDGGFGPRTGASDGTSLYVLRPDGILERRDGRDGRRIASVRVALRGAVVAAADGRVLLARDDGVAAVDAVDGRALWQRRLGIARLNQAVVAGRSLWVQGTPRDGSADRLWRLDASTGRVLESLTLPEFRASGMAAVGDRLWIATSSGRLQIVGRD
jgi:outer membrane protein assembly factor BamB